MSGTHRRTLLTAGLTGAATLLAGCGGSSGALEEPSSSLRTIRYGDDDQQHAELRRPAGKSKGTVVLIHGGYWQAGYGSDLMVPLARAFTRLGYATWNVEYRRVGSGGGFPSTLEDVAAAMDALPKHQPGPAVVVGHSAGGQLAVWAASRTARTPGGAPASELRAAVSLSGLLDLTAAAGAPESGSPTLAFMGADPQESPGTYALADPARLVPAACPVVACQAADDQVIPRDQAARYVAAATAAGGRASTRSLPGDHFTLIDPGSDDFPAIRGLVARALA